MANKAQVMAAAPAASPSLLAKAYAAAVVSRNTNARKTKILVQMPALWVCAFTPKASNRESTTRTMVPAISLATTHVCAQLTAVVEREGEVDECLLAPALLAAVVLLHDVVDLRDGCGDE